MNRKAAEKYIINAISKIDKDNENRYKEIFSKMNNKQFDNYIEALRNNDTNIFVYMPNFEKGLTNEKIVNIAKSLGVKLYERIKSVNPETGQEYYKDNKYLILKLPVRRVKQYLLKKLQVPVTDKRVNKITGQMMGESKGAKLSFVESGFLASKGLEAPIVEMVKIRGGDSKNYHEFKKNIALGDNSLNQLDLTGSRPKIINTLQKVFLAMMLDINLSGE